MTVLEHDGFAALIEELGEKRDVFFYATAIQLDRFKPKVDGGLNVALEALQIVAHGVLAVAVVAAMADFSDEQIGVNLRGIHSPVPSRDHPEAFRLVGHGLHGGEKRGVDDGVAGRVMETLAARASVALLPAKDKWMSADDAINLR